MRQAREPVRRHLQHINSDLVGNRVQVHMQGGDLLVEFAEDDRVFMTGPVVYIGSITLAEKFLCMNREKVRGALNTVTAGHLWKPLEKSLAIAGRI